MTSIQPPGVRFSGYQVHKNGRQAGLFLPGYQQNVSAVRAEVIRPGENANKAGMETIALEKSGEYWRTPQGHLLPLGSDYRFQVQKTGETEFKSIPLDLLETVSHGQQGEFNRISPHSSRTPQKSTVMADIYQDSVVSPQDLKKLDGEKTAQPHVPNLPMRNHFNRFIPQEQGLQSLFPLLEKSNVTGLMFKPFIGGDKLSSHGYWTIDPYVLNDTFSSKAAMRASLGDMLKRGIKVHADGAFVNQGLNGVQMMANLAYRFNSPYWSWFKSGENSDHLGPVRFPRYAHEKFVFGILPTKQDASGLRSLDLTRVRFEIENDPRTPTYQAERPTFLKLSPTANLLDESIRTSNDSVQPYRFPVDPQEVLKKEKQSDYLEWSHFRLSQPSEDDSQVKWDGKVDVALMNTRNEEVRDYLNTAVGYWSRMVMNTYTHDVAKALWQAKANSPKGNMASWLQSVSHGAQAVLPEVPPAEQAQYQARLPELLQQAQMRAQHPEVGAGKEGKAFAKRLLDEIPMSVVNLPVLFQATLSLPAFQASLRQQKRTGLAGLLENGVLKPLSHLPVVGGLFRMVKNWIFPPAFEKQLSHKLQEAFAGLPAQVRAKLRHQDIQSVLADRVGEKIYLSLLTGKPLQAVDQAEQRTSASQEFEEAFYKNMPWAITHSDPVTASKLLPDVLSSRLQGLNSTVLANLVERELRALDPAMVAVAKNVLQEREFGLNWRIDAAKDVADIDAIRRAEPADKPALFRQEMAFARGFWKKLTASMREPFPKAAIIAELTDFEALANDPAVAREEMATFFRENIFTSTPNMRYTYSSPLELVHYAAQPHQHGASQLNVQRFLDEHVKGSSQSVPLPSQMQFQTMVSSHDYPTVSHSLLVNPMLFNIDRMPAWSLKDAFDTASAELESKACFAPERAELGAALEKIGMPASQLPVVLESLRAWLKLSSDSHIKDNLQAEGYGHLREFVDKIEQKSRATYRETPMTYKQDFVNGLFAVLQNQKQSLMAHTPDPQLPPHPLTHLVKLAQHPEVMNQLKQVLSQRMAEPGEAKAMRAVVQNAVLAYDFGQSSGLSPQEAEQTRQAIWKALNVTIANWGAHWGYQPLDKALKHVFENLDRAACPKQLNVTQLELNLYQAMNQPVMEKLLRVTAIQNALPGSPSIYLPDFLVEGGAEVLNNVYAQNRGVNRVDKAQTDATYQRQFLQPLQQMFEARKNQAALNNGTLVPVTVPDGQGILPLIRDNGQEQVMALINTGRPMPLQQERFGLVGFDSPDYRMVQTAQPQVTVSAEKPVLLNSSYLTAGRYEDLLTQRRFRLEATPGDSTKQAASWQLKPESGTAAFSTQLLLKRLPA